MKKDIFIINPKSNIAISTLWRKKEYILQKIPEKTKKKIGIIGTTYTSFGINYMLETLAENPQINILILYGDDLSTSGDTIFNTFGKKEISKIIVLDRRKVKEIIDTIELIDLRKEAKDGKIEKLIEEIEKNYKENEIKRKKFKLRVEEKSKVESYPIPLSGHLIYDSESVFRIWIKILDLIMRFGNLKFTEYEIPQKEYLNVVATLGLYGKEYKMEKEFFEFIERENFERHINEVLNPKKPDGVEYTYGERFFSHRYGKNQINYLIEKLSKAPYSRRALVVSWDHEVDQNVQNPPCIIAIQGIITENFYNHVVILRSNDMFKAWPINFVAQIELAKYIVNEINKRANTDFKIGNITSISISAHVYQSDFEVIKKVLEKYYYKINEFVNDPKGNFIIYLENGKVAVEHRSPDNSILLFKKEFENFDEAYKFFKNENLFTLYSHSLYLSKELKNAFEKLERGEEYFQDSN